MSYTLTTENDYLVGVSEELTMNGTNAVNGPVISEKLGAQKILVGIDITAAGGADAAQITIAYSHDGVNFTAETELVADVLALTTGVKLFLIDLTSIEAPYYRLSLGGVASLGTSGTFKLIFAVPANRYV